MIIDIKRIKIFVTHYKKLLERKSLLKRSLCNMKLESEWIEEYDAEELSSIDIEKYYLPNLEIWKSKIDWICDGSFRRLRLSEISLAIKHINIYEKIISNRHDMALILEDDVIFADSFIDVFNRYFKECPDDFDMIFIGNGCNLRIGQTFANKHFYEKSNPAAKCTDSYILTLAAAKKIMSDILPISVPIDFELNNSIRKHSIKTYWLEPPIVEQGSQNGAFKTSVQ